MPHITDMLEGDAGESVCRRIKQHLVGCETCRMYVDAHKRVIHLYKRWRDEKLPTAVEIRLRERLRAVMAARRGKRRASDRHPHRGQGRTKPRR